MSNVETEHPRHKIRQAFVKHLINKTQAKSNVYDSRVKPLFDQHLPALLIYTRDERILETQYDGDGFAPYKRELELSVEGVMANCPELDEKIDLLALEIERSLIGFEIPGFLNSTIKLKSTETDVIGDGSRFYGALRLMYGVTYYTTTLKE